jgi:CRISPR-associated endonuclease/helicase Cas3
MSERVYGHTKDGKPIDDKLIEVLADEAEHGYQPAQLKDRHRGRGRPPLGDAAKGVESVRLDTELRQKTASRAAAEGVSVSEVIRRALRQYLKCA